MRNLLLTNDDGVDAPGIEALRRAVSQLGSIRIVAPHGPQSGCGHAVTTHRGIAIHDRGDRTFAVEGTPADCVRLGIDHLAKETDWVISGINHGGNLGADVFHSGTAAAAREAVLHGKPAIAISHYLARNRPVDWEAAARRASGVIASLLEQPWTPGTFWNVNLPHPAPGSPEPEVVVCPLDPSPLPLRFRVDGGSAVYCGDYQTRARIPGADIDVCFGGSIAVSLIPLVP